MSHHSLDLFRALDSSISEIVSGRIGFVHDLFLQFNYEIVDQLPDCGSDLVVITGKDDRQRKLTELADYPGRCVVAFAPGDASFRAGHLPAGRHLPSNIVGLHVSNNELPDRRIHNIPLGVRINKLLPLKFVKQNVSSESRKLLYINFTVNDQHYQREGNGTPHIRARLAEQFKAASSWATVEINAAQKGADEDLMHYYTSIASHRFVLSPEGNGVDCYRTWEALYLGAIPVVMSSTCVSTFADLPVLVTEDYSEITEEYLEQQWSLLSQKRFNLRKLFKSYYFERFLDDVSQLHNPRFVCWGFAGTADEKFHDVLKTSSRHASGILEEVPLPPYTANGRPPLEPGNWTASEFTKLGRQDGGLRLVKKNPVPGAAQLRLATVPGAAYCISGSFTLDQGSSEPLLGVTDAAQLPLTTEPPLLDLTQGSFTLRFVARDTSALFSIAYAGDAQRFAITVKELVISLVA